MQSSPCLLFWHRIEFVHVRFISVQFGVFHPRQTVASLRRTERLTTLYCGTTRLSAGVSVDTKCEWVTPVVTWLVISLAFPSARLFR